MRDLINLNSVIENDSFERFSLDYQKNSKLLEKTDQELSYLKEEISKEKDIKELFKEYLDTDKDSLYAFLYNNPLFGQFVREKLRQEELSSNLGEQVESFNLDKLKLFRDCKHVFGLMHGNYICINCALSYRDLLIITEEELDTFKDVVDKKGRFAGTIKDEEEAYLDLIYEQHLKNCEKKILKRTK